jgi:hypothetical protein
VTASRIVPVARDVAPLAEGTRLIHIGPQKTGSTAIQAVMHARRPELAELGVVYPGPRMRPQLAGAEIGFPLPRGKRPGPPGAWQRLVDEVVGAGEKRVCISHEAFGRANATQVERIITDLGGDRPHVLAVLRRYDTLLPSQWQQRVKAGVRLSYDDWLRIVLGEDQSQSEWQQVWSAHDTVTLVRRWAERVDPSQITLLVGEDSDRTLLPDVFERLLDLPAGFLGVDLGNGNRSLSYPETELVRGLYDAFAEAGRSKREHFRLIHRGVIAGLVTSPFPEGEPRIPALPEWAYDRVIELSERRVEGLADLGVRILGAPERLRVVRPDASAGSIPEIGAVSLTTALRALEGMARGALEQLPEPPASVRSGAAPDESWLSGSWLSRWRRR